MPKNRPTLILWSAALLVAGLFVTTATSVASDAKPETKVLVTNLESPSGLAIHKKTGHVFIASRYGVYRYDPKQEDREKRVTLEIDAYPTDIYGKGPMYNVGPLGLAFMDDDHLVVGDGSRKDGEELVRVYKVSDAPLEKWIKEDQAAFTLGPIPASDQTAMGEGNFYGIAVGAGAIFVTSNGDDTKGWIAKSVIEDGKPGDLTLSIATKVKTEEKLGTGVDAPGPATFTPDGELLIGQIGEVNVEGDSLLTFYDAGTGELKRALKTTLDDIAGVAYSPKTKKLYATDFAWLDPSKEKDEDKKGGVYELTIAEDNVEAKLIAKLDKPAALVFDEEGQLYVTIFGTQEEGSDLSPGQLIVITGEL